MKRNFFVCLSTLILWVLLGLAVSADSVRFEPGIARTVYAASDSQTAKYKNMEAIPNQEKTSSFVEYIESIYRFGISIVAILAVFMIGLGAFQYIVSSAGNAGKMADGKDMIMSAIFGLIIAMLIYVTLFLVNPDLLKGTMTGTSEQEGYTPEGTGEIPKLAVGCNDTVDSAINTAASSYDLDPNVLRALVRCGEGCNPNKSSAGACGYSQTMPSIRKWCGISGTKTESCLAVQNDTNLDMLCAAKLVKTDFMKRCGTDIQQIASCYNTGKKNNCARAQNNYCSRVANCE